jgi:ADP-ribose pyrophosphatase
MSDEVKLPDGRTATRNWVNYPAAVVILPYIDDERIVLIEQYRYSLKRTIFELPAGKIDDPSEPKESAASRELLEGDRIPRRKDGILFSFYPAVGYSSEILHAFTARDLVFDRDDPDDDEFIDTHIVPISEALEMIRRGEICDSKTMLLLFHQSAEQEK